jgi:hypothetical protein
VQFDPNPKGGGVIEGRTSGPRRSRALLAALVVWLAATPTAGAAVISMGGIDTESQYTGAGTGSGDAGILTFDDALNGMNAAEPGVVTTSDIAALIGKSVAFEVILAATQPNGDPFNPLTDNVKNARFLGTGPSDFRIYDNLTSTTLLAFNIIHIDVTNATKAVAGLDPDGSITLGDPTETATSSLLVISGGTLNNLAGGIGTQARLQVQFVTLTPAILVKADFSGYLNDNFTSGFGAAPVSTSTWDLTIIPEPSTAALVGFSLLGLVAIARRRSRGGL